MSLGHSPRLGRNSATFLCCVASMPLCARFIDGVKADSLASALLAGTLLGLSYLLLRPILKLLTLPIGCLTLGLFGLVIDTALIYALNLFPLGVTISSAAQAFLCALLVNGLCLIVGGAR